MLSSVWLAKRKETRVLHVRWVLEDSLYYLEHGSNIVDGKNKTCEIIEQSREKYIVDDGASDHENTHKNNAVQWHKLNIHNRFRVQEDPAPREPILAT